MTAYRRIREVILRDTPTGTRRLGEIDIPLKRRGRLLMLALNTARRRVLQRYSVLDTASEVGNSFHLNLQRQARAEIDVNWQSSLCSRSGTRRYYPYWGCCTSFTFKSTGGSLKTLCSGTKSPNAFPYLRKRRHVPTCKSISSG